jgi:transaldolase
VRIWVDTAIPAEIEEWDEHPWVSGFTTNPTLIKQAGVRPQDVVKLTEKPISIDGHPDAVWALGEHTYCKIALDHPTCYIPQMRNRLNLTAVCSLKQLRRLAGDYSKVVISVFAGRIMDTGRDPQPVIDAAKATGAQVLWASVREPYNIRQAEEAGCDIVTVPPAILRKHFAWYGKPLEVVAAETIAQFQADAEGTQW